MAESNGTANTLFQGVADKIERDMRQIAPGAKQILRHFPKHTVAEQVLDELRHRSIIVEEGYSLSISSSEEEFLLIGQAPNCRRVVEEDRPIPFKLADPKPQSGGAKLFSEGFDVVEHLPKSKSGRKATNKYRSLVEAIEREARPGWIKVAEFPDHRKAGTIRLTMRRYGKNWKVKIRKNDSDTGVSVYVNKDPNAVN